jgi:eukaryotic-like serine/threonine-protein kinase
MLGAILDEKYRIEMEIASGGMGTIWTATDLRLGRRVAVKLLRREKLGSIEARNLFIQEARLVAQLQHPNVVQIFDYGVHAGAPYFVMELLHGEDLSALLHKQHRRQLESLASIVTQTARALSAAHAAGIVHRDLKPSNIFLTRSGDEEVVKLLDFGISILQAGVENQEGNQEGKIAGTPAYMSPEQLRSEPADARSDLWSLAVILYRSLTGKRPFQGEHYIDLLRKVAWQPHLPPSQLAPELGARVDQFFDRALAKDPAQRFQSATELAAAFAALLEAPAASRQEKLLFVDDEPDVAVLVRHRLRPLVRAGMYELLFALNGVEALERLRANPDIAVVVTDINMPEMDGLTLLARIGEMSPLVKVIVLSAYSDMMNLRTAMNRGAFDFLVKPIDFADLEVTLEKTVRHVKELRRTVRSTEENSLLRLFVGNGIVDRLLPSLRSIGATPSEEIPAAVAFISLRGAGPDPGTPPDAVMRELNASFEVIVPELLSCGASVERFMGRTLLALHRGEDCIEHLAEACLAAREKLWSTAERAGAGSPYRYTMSAGIDAGLVIVGTVGSRSHCRMDYVVLGNAVQTAAALEAAAGINEILLARETFRPIVGRFSGRMAGKIVLPGEDAPVELYDLLSTGTETSTEPSHSGARPAREVEQKDAPRRPLPSLDQDAMTVQIAGRRPG